MTLEFTSWLCHKCNKPGISSWNDAAHGGIDWQGAIPNPLIIGDNCQECGHPVVVAYTTKEAPPTVIYGPHPVSAGISATQFYEYENAATEQLEAAPDSGQTLKPSFELV